MSESKEGLQEVELLIEDYLEGRMAPEQRKRFEERVRKDAELRDRLATATRSVALVQQALGWVTPGDDFDEKVSTKIISITQSWQNLQPYVGAGGRSLSGEDADAQLLADPEAAREKRRLIILAIVAALLFLLAASAIGYSIAVGVQKPVPEEQPKP